MNKEQLQGLLNQRYNVKNWEKIYGSIFPNVTLFSSPKEIPVTESWVKSFRQRGLVRLDGNQDVAIFEVVLQDGSSIQSKRVGLRDLVAKLIDEYQNHGVLAVFDNGSPEYRFTFAAKETKVTREGIEKSETDSKRYTYILGETETCKTAAEQFIKLSEKGSLISLSDLQEAFSVEKLSKQFFDEYTSQYKAFRDYLASQPTIIKSVFLGDEKKMRDFVKLLLGRLVFLQFVQKKKWLGVPAKNKDWHSGDVRFLVNAFDGFANKDKFYSDYLEELFFQCLNNPNRKNEIFELSGTKVPFLNGGLFENDNAKTKNVNFPATYFTGLFEFFGKYNFTIDENDPTEKEVGIDPEMLGSIFENLLEDNKDKGAFYTPKEIVHYMCQESLIEYLNTKVNVEQDDAVSDSIRLFIIKRKTDEHILKLVSPLANALRDVKICDPAIGSGAFPMGMLMEIFHVVFELYNANPKIVSREWNMNGWQPNIVKSNIIQNSIYGVDIEKGAVDIARLRFWLSLIVDEDEPKALPNLDYKIVVGNSLVSKLGEDIIDIDWEVKANTDAAKKLQQEIQNNLNKLFNTQKLFFDFNGKKENLKAEIRNLKIDVLISQLQLDKYKYGNSSAQIGSLFEMTSKEKAADQERKQRLTGFDKTIRELQRLKSNPDLPLNFFDWKLDFPEVLNDSINSEPGFDIVIGNPPYVEAKKLKHISLYLKSYRVYSGNGDLSSYFFELGIKLSKAEGLLCYINTNKFFNTGYGKPVRELIIENEIKQLLNFEQVEVFEGILVSSVIISIKNKINSQYNVFPYKKFFKLKNTEFVRTFAEQIENRELYQQKHLTEKEWSFANDSNLALKIKIESGSTQLKNIKGVNVYRGITTGYNPAFIISNEQKINLLKENKNNQDIIKPLLQGRNIRKWEYNFNEEYILQTGYEINIKKSYPGIFEHLSKFKGELVARADQGRDWWNLRACKYYGDFEKPKIIWGLTADKWAFAYDESFHYLPSNGYILTSNKTSIKYLLAIINSNLLKYYFGFIGVMTAGGAFTLKHSTILELPVKITSNEKILIKHVDQILRLKSQGKETLTADQELDNLVYRLYELSYDEVKVIDPEFPLSQKEYENISLE
jgi:adenine-specific DNA-methyltransferase